MAGAGTGVLGYLQKLCTWSSARTLLVDAVARDKLLCVRHKAWKVVLTLLKSFLITME